MSRGGLQSVSRVLLTSGVEHFCHTVVSLHMHTIFRRGCRRTAWRTSIRRRRWWRRGGARRRRSAAVSCWYSSQRCLENSLLPSINSVDPPLALAAPGRRRAAAPGGIQLLVRSPALLSCFLAASYPCPVCCHAHSRI